MYRLVNSHHVPQEMLDRLEHACAPLHHAFGKGNTFLVGSALERETFRDLDVRTISDELLPKPLVTFIEVVTSGCLTARVRCPVDFQLRTPLQVLNDYSDTPAFELGVDRPPTVISITRHTVRLNG